MLSVKIVLKDKTKSRRWKVKKKKRKRIKRRGRNFHHLTPKSRFGSSLPNNLLLIDIEKHEYFHKIFGNMTLEEVIRLLCRLKELKNR
jgi:hypothetical protein